MSDKAYNRYKKGLRALQVFLPLCLFTFLLVSCGGDEDIDVSFRDPSLNFQPAQDDQSFTAQLRRQFQEKYGSYLLFNDTLQHVYQGDDPNGTPVYFTERLDIDYSVGSTTLTNARYYYTLIEGDSLKQEAVDFMEQFILPHLTGKLKPYSWLLCVRVNGNDNMNRPITANTYSQVGQRAAVVAFNYIFSRKRNDSQKQNFANRVINGIVGQLAYNNTDAFTHFYSYSSEYYNVNFPSPAPSVEEQRQRGFISTGAGSYPSQQADLNTFVATLVTNDYAALQTRYANYPIILQKLAACRETLISLGYVF